jgi:fluoride exporter
MNLGDIGLVALAGSVGACCRFVVDGIVRARRTTRLPVGTVVINVSGSLILGVLTGLVVYHHAPTTLTLVAGTGFCGGYTTFSTSSFETVRLLQQGETATALGNIALSVGGVLAAAAAGLALASI